MMAWMLTLPLLVAQAASDPAVTDAVSQAAQTAATTTATPADAAAGITGLWKLLIAVAILFGSFGLGHLLSQWLRLPEYAFKLGLIALSIFGSAAICYFGWPPKLGIDLSGGVVLVYEVEESAANAGRLQDLADTVASRINQGRKQKVTATVVDGTIELRLPADSDVALVENKVTSLRGDNIVLTQADKREEDGVAILVYRPDQTFQRVQMDELVGAVNKRINPGGVKEVTVRQYGPESIEIIIPEVEQSEVDHIKRIIEQQGALEFRILANPRKPEHRVTIERAQASRDREVVLNTPEGREVKAKWVEMRPDVGDHNAIVRERPDGKGLEALVMIDLFNVKGVRRASEGVDQAGSKAVNFMFDSERAHLFGALTGSNLPDAATGVEQRLGIVLDNVLISAPNLKSQIRDQGEITGIDNPAEVKMIIDVLNAGSLPNALHKTPIQEQRISAQLGADTIEQGSRAMAIASLGVVVFMLVYYRFAGAVADGAVMLNLLMAIAGMILIKAAFTLPGLAGLVLTVGMAVDANVLIYERMREEQKRGASLRMAIRNGYSRAFSTIIDSHVTTIATGVVLFAIGSDQIKGFAVTLILGLLVSLYTSVYVSRVVFDICEKKRWLTRLNMMQWFRQTNIDFVGWMRPAAILSLVVIGIGLVGVFARGKDLLDIDFIGGSSVQVQFKADQPQDIAEVRKEVSQLPDSTVSAVGTQNLEFKIDTSERDLSKVRESLKEVFQGKLNTYSMTFEKLRPYEEPKRAVEAPATTETPAEKPLAEESKAPETQPEAAEDPPAADSKTEEPKETPTESETHATEKPAEETPPKEDDKPAGADPEPVPSIEGTTPSDTDENKTVAKRSGGGGAAGLAIATLVAAQVETEGDAKQPDAAAETNDADGPKTEAAAPEVPKPETAASEAPEANRGTSADLHFSAPINQATLRDRINAELKEHKIDGTFFDLSNPEHAAGGSARYSNWTLNILQPEDATEKLLTAMQEDISSEPVFPSANQIGGKVAGRTQLAAVYAILASLVIIIVYVWIRFQNVLFGLAAVVALIHDVLVALGFIALSYWMSNNLGMEALLVDPFKISLAVVAALLTIVGYSINDTIVIFDRIREMRGKSPDLTGKMINQAVNETLSRTFITSGTVFIATFILYVVGGAGIHPFAYAMLIGVISGTYSTIFIAAPILLLMKPPSGGSGRPPASSKVPVTSSR